jgi:hypothetical protein
MNLINRIKKLEAAGPPESPALCGCYRDQFEIIAEQVYAGENPTGVLDPPTSDICEKCRKPVPVATFSFNRNLEHIYGGEA